MLSYQLPCHSIAAATEGDQRDEQARHPQYGHEGVLQAPFQLLWVPKPLIDYICFEVLQFLSITLHTEFLPVLGCIACTSECGEPGPAVPKGQGGL
jgi:hypothetical protein